MTASQPGQGDAAKTAPGQNDKVGDERMAKEPYHSLVVELASAKALEILRADRWRTRLEAIGLSSGAVILLIAIGGFLANEVLDTRVSKHIDASLYEKLEVSNYRMELAFLELKSERLSSTDELSEEMLKEVVDTTRVLLNRFITNPDVPVAIAQARARSVRPVLATLINVSAGVGRGDFVNEIVDLAPDIVETSDDVTQTLVQHTGLRLIGESGAPDVWLNEEGEPTDQYRRYKTYAERARDTGYPEVFLVFELVMRHMLKRPEEEVVGLIQDAETLNMTDSEHFATLMVAFSTGAYTVRTDASSVRVVERYREFLQEYRSRSELIEQFYQMIWMPEGEEVES